MHRQGGGCDHLVDRGRRQVDRLQDGLFDFVQLQFGGVMDCRAVFAPGGFDELESSR